MKRGLYLLVSLLIGLLFVVRVNASEKVIVYVFEGSTCPHCAELKTFLNDLKNDDDYKDKFDVKEYEIWNHSDNKELANRVAEVMGDTLNGVPYYIIGNKSYSGFKESDKETIKKAISSLFSEGYNDPIKDVVQEFDNKLFSWTGILVVAGIIMVLGAFIYFAQKE